ncbi:hypothetical protein GGI42DRAFT_272658 [Trichoderma sp. SZMC 28013]
MSLFNSSVATLLLSTGVQVWFPAAQVSESEPQSLRTLSQPASKQINAACTMEHIGRLSIDIMSPKLTFHPSYRHR